jgi:hypothetical protein
MDLRQLMNPTLIALAVAVILVVAVFAWLYMQGRRRTTTAELRQRFGPDYVEKQWDQGDHVDRRLVGCPAALSFTLLTDLLKLQPSVSLSA